MKNKIWIIIAVAFIAVMVLAAILYPKLAEHFAMNNDAQTPPMYNVTDLDKEATDKAPAKQTEDFTVYDSDMNEVKLSEHFGKPIIINFWASWCYPCKSELPAFDTMHDKYGDEVVFLMINLTDGQRETVSGIKNFIADNGYTFPVYYDIEYDASNAYGVYSIPETVFINADGSLYDIRVGAMNEVTLETYIKKLLGGK